MHACQLLCDCTVVGSNPSGLVVTVFPSAWTTDHNTQEGFGGRQWRVQGSTYEDHNGDHVYDHKTTVKVATGSASEVLELVAAKTQLLAHVWEVWLSIGVVYPMLPRSLGPREPF